MHELSIALEVCRLAEERLGVETPQLRRVNLTVGADSGLEPENLSFCLDALLGQPPFGAAVAQLTLCPGDALRVDSWEVEDDPDD